ncbi:DUF3107 domain-containing protein [Kocuria coralli]|uniref:DUF3107 domain-containing protein n=1 Tax=Kocuria coralli TaxID=1461025 RepID=A0A5J5L0U2_9MICC|nr:DUF3107 domain-containing protein [Kocuria coralli]KAA9395547.1 DUF3107 domain-containing protein [Kocuria coralli]
MEIKIGIQHVGREVVVDSALTAEKAQELVSAALADGSVLTLTDTKDHTTLVPASGIAYVEIGTETRRKVGFMPGVGND